MQLANRECTWVSISSHASLSIAVGISSQPGAVFPAFNIAISVSHRVIGADGRAFWATVEAFISMLPTSTQFEGRLPANIMHLSVNEVAGEFSGELGFLVEWIDK